MVSADNCLVCESHITRNIDSPTCSCKNGYYEIDSLLECEVCP